MPKVINYTVVHDEVQVRKYIANGWQPFGGVTASQNGHITDYSQAMVKYEVIDPVQ